MTPSLAGRISIDATSAIGLASYVGWLATMLITLVATGTTVLVSRLEGMGEHRKADGYASQSLSLAAIIGFFIAVGIFLLAPAFARGQNMQGETFLITVEYLRFDAVGLWAASLTFVGCAALRGYGNTRTPMLIFVVINVINVIVSCSLVYGVGPLEPMGVRGIVTGTVTARILGAGLTLGVLISGQAGIKLRPLDLPIRREAAVRLLRIGLPAAVDGAIMWAGHFVFLSMIARLEEGARGQAYYAAHIVAMRVEALTYLPAFAWGTAAATMIGQALGAGDPDRARRAGHAAAKQCGLLSVFIAVLFFFGADVIFTVMQKDALVREVGAPPFRVLALLQPLLVISIVYVNALRGAGDTRFPLLITLIGTLVFRLPLGALGGFYLGWGLLGAWMGMFGDQICRATLASWRYAGGRWLKTRV